VKLSIVTVGYHSSKTLTTLLESLAQQTDGYFDMFLINNSQDDAEEITELAKKYSFVKYIANPINNGFAGGNNIGIDKAFKNGSDWVLLLNPDTEVSHSLTEELKLNLKDKYGLVGIPTQEPDHITFGGKFSWLKAELAQNTSKPSGGFYVNGGALLIEKSSYEKIGPLDENYFLYFEDTDYSFRAVQQGIWLSYLDSPTVSHLVSASTKALGPSIVLRYHFRNSLYYNKKNGPWYIKLLVWPWSMWIITKQVLKIILGIHPSESKAIVAGVLDFYSVRMGIISH